MTQREFSTRVLQWFDRHGRHDLPWQVSDPYRIWLAEVMLQQTQVTTVIPYFARFCDRFPDVHKLAAAPLDEVLHLWSGLGYYARARNLHKAAQDLVAEHHGEFPRTVSGLISLPGIGRSTAGAIAAQAFGLRAAILDGNVKRVLTRYHAVEGWPECAAVARTLWEIAERYTPNVRVRDYTQAIMDLGATVCTRSSPNCAQCPLSGDCQAFTSNTIEQYPARKPRPPLRTKRTRVLIIRSPRGEFLLEKRPPTGIWGGLWSFPEITLETDPRSACERLIGVWPLSCSEQPQFRHTFSHFHLEIHPVLLDIATEEETLRESSDAVWYANGDMRVGLAAPVGRLIDNLAG